MLAAEIIESIFLLQSISISAENHTCRIRRNRSRPCPSIRLPEAPGPLPFTRFPSEAIMNGEFSDKAHKRLKGGILPMARMFRVLGFTAFLIAMMALAGNLIEMA